MTRSIKIQEELYAELDTYRGKGQTFSDALRKVLKVSNTLYGIRHLLGDRHIITGPHPPTRTNARLGESVEDREPDGEEH